MDSPGHCAQYCTYTMMDNASKKIVSLITLDKRQAAGKSGNLEKAGFLKSMNMLAEQEVSVSEVVTDAHMQITAVMSKLSIRGYFEKQAFIFACSNWKT